MSAPKLQTLHSKSTRPLLAAMLSVLIGFSTSVEAWWGDGHLLLTQASVRALPDQMPAFFRSNAEVIAHVSYDADLAKNRGVPLVSDGEFPEHNFDLELLRGESFPDKRYDFVELCHQLDVRPEIVGFAPYAVAEWTQRLAVAFAEYRRWPQNPTIQSKILVYAGFLAHYSQDMLQPLHITIHYDGRVDESGDSPHSGIHELVDSAIQRMAFDPTDLAQGLTIDAIEGDLFTAIRAQIHESNGRVDRLYALAGDLEGADGPSTEEARTFIRDGAQRATHFTASLFVTAWSLSEELRLHSWLNREAK